MRKMDKKKFIGSIILVTALIGFGSHLLLTSTLLEGETSRFTQTMRLDNYGRLLTIENTKYNVFSVERSPSENTVKLDINSESQGEITSADENITKENDESWSTTLSSDHVEVSENAYDAATKTSGQVIIFQETRKETEKPTIWPFSASLGIAAGALLGAVWLSKVEARGNATSVLLGEGLENMSVRDAEIVGEIMRRKEFTIPEIKKKSGTSKITTWRTVKKLVEEGLVEETERTKAPSNGLGGRGKPSQVYKYVGPRENEE